MTLCPLAAVFPSPVLRSVWLPLIWFCFLVSEAAGRSLAQYEGGYIVDTAFDGSKTGIEPHTVDVTPAGELLVLDSINSNMYRVQLPLS
jgi:hypothetical protein